LTLQVECQEGHLAHKNPVVVPIRLSFVRAPAYPGYPGSYGHKTVARLRNDLLCVEWDDKLYSLVYTKFVLAELRGIQTHTETSLLFFL